MKKEIKSELRTDEIGFGNLKLTQAVDEFCYGVDAVILADFASKISKTKGLVFDFGTGTGVIPLIISHKLKNCKIVGVELQEKSAKLAKANVRENGLEDRITILNSNILDIDSKYYSMVDVVVSNPPYMAKNGALQNLNDAKSIARHETAADLEQFFMMAAKLLKDRGQLFMVHRPSRLVDLLAYGRKYKLEAKTMQMVAPKNGAIPNIVLLHFVKNGGKELKILKPLDVHKEGGAYTDEILEIYEK